MSGPIPASGGQAPLSPLGPSGRTQATGSPANVRQYAPWVARVIAFVIDYIPAFVLNLVGAILGRPYTEVVQRETQGYSYSTIQSHGYGIVFYFFVALGVIWLLWNKGLLEGTTGKSIGKRLTHYTTLNEVTGKPLGAGMGVVRVILLYIDFLICFVGVLWPLWDAKRQCLLSDKLTKAVVYKDTATSP